MDFLKRYRFDLITICLLIIIPVVAWVMMRPITERFASPFLIWTSAGQLTALVGMTMVSLSMIFQVRHIWLCKIMSKPTTLSNAHHYLGLWGLFLLLLHPLLLAIKYVPISLKLSADFLFTRDIINLTGLLALMIMLIAIYATLFVEKTFRFWKLLHQLLLVSYGFILYHLFFVTSDITANIYLRGYVLGLAILGGLSFAVQKTIFYIKKKQVA